MQDQNPYAAPQTIDDNSFKTSSPGLPNLAQQSRLASLKGARGILLVVGILSLVGCGAGLIARPGSMSDALGMALALGAAGGATLTVLGLLIYRMPIIATVISLIIYTAMIVVVIIATSGRFSVNLWYLKIMFFIALLNAVKAAFAYEKEQKISGSRTF